MKLPVYAMDSGGSCGENVLYAFDSNTRILTISGTGAMAEYDWNISPPWEDHRNAIRRIVINDFVTSIGAYAFEAYRELTSIDKY